MVRFEGRTDIPLHTGKAPAWLFERMTLLAREVLLAIIGEEVFQVCPRNAYRWARHARANRRARDRLRPESHRVKRL